jgi:hypothetical protein
MYRKLRRPIVEIKTNMSHDGLNPTHVPYWWVNIVGVQGLAVLKADILSVWSPSPVSMPELYFRP